jgi:hypothetical protein
LEKFIANYNLYVLFPETKETWEKAPSHLTPSKKSYNQCTQNIKFTFAGEPSHHHSSFESLDSIVP